MKRVGWRRVSQDPPVDHEWWQLEPFDPELSFVFDRSHYDATIDAEIRIAAVRQFE